MSTKDKIINFRPLFFCFVAFFCAIIFAKEIISLNLLYISLFCLFFVLILIISIVRKQFIKVIAVFISFIVGLGVFTLDFNLFNGNSYSGIHNIQGQIEVINDYSIVLNNVKIDDVSQKNVYVNIPFTKNLELGQILSFEAEIDNAQLFELGKFNSMLYKYNTPYITSVGIDEITVISQGRLNIFQRFRQSVHRVLVQNVSEENVGLFYGILFGDKSELDYELRQSYQTSGISHLLAVSGLHVGVFVAVVNFILDKFKVNRKIKFLICFIILLIYCSLCSFSPSVVRASLMTLIVLLSSIFGRQYDFTNSISLAGIIILLFSPLTAFDVGFQLSFLCVFSLAFVLPLVTRLSSKIKLPNFIKNTLAMTISIQIGLLPLTSYYFGEFSILSILTNIVCIPLFQIGFISLIIVTLICLPLQFMSFLFVPIAYIFDLIKIIATFTSSLTVFILNLSSFNIIGILCYSLGVFILSNFVNLKRYVKIIISLCLILTVFVYTGLLSVPKEHNDLFIYQYSNQCHIIVSSSNQKLIINNNSTIPFNFTNHININKIDYLLGLSISDTNEIESYYNIKSKAVYESDTVLGDFDIKYVKLLDRVNYVLIEVDGHIICYMLDCLNDAEQTLFNDISANINIIINNTFTSTEVGDYKLNSKEFICQNLKYKQNNFGIKIKNGKLNKIWSLN